MTHNTRTRAAALLFALLAFGTARAQQAKPAEDALAKAAHAAGEPSLQEILDKLGYSVDVQKDEIHAERFRRAGRGPITHQPIAAYGLIQVCTGGWYPAPRPFTGEAKDIPQPTKQTQWQVDAPNNKQAAPPLMKGAKTAFDPGDAVFGLWVSTAGFKDETVYTQDALQGFVPRFKADDRHKARIYPVKKNGKLVPNAYIIGWEYSTNNDFQDIVTLVTNVSPITAEK